MKLTVSTWSTLSKILLELTQ